VDLVNKAAKLKESLRARTILRTIKEQSSGNGGLTWKFLGFVMRVTR
jgi:hypothetical protein